MARTFALLCVIGLLSFGLSGNQPPRAQSLVLYVRPCEPLEVVLFAEDPDGDKLEFEILNTPEIGKLRGTHPVPQYWPKPAFEGRDRVAFLVRDPYGAFDIGTVELVFSSKLASLKVVPHVPVFTSVTDLVDFLASRGVRTWYVVELPKPKPIFSEVMPFVFLGKGSPNFFLFGPKEKPNLAPLSGPRGLSFLDFQGFPTGEYLLLIVAEGVAYSLPVVIPASDRKLAYSG